MNRKPHAIVVGAGAGGAAAARKLQGRFEVTIIEAGGGFRPNRLSFAAMERIRNCGFLFDERQIGLVFPSMRVRKSPDGTILVNGRGPGGTTTICTANALRADGSLRALGLDLEEEYAELEREIPMSTGHRGKWREVTRRLFEIGTEMGFAPEPTPKMVDSRKCRQCGRCIFGCPYGAKWESRRFIEDAVSRGAKVMTRSRVKKVITDNNGRTKGVLVGHAGRTRFHPADLVVLAAGGMGTPDILTRSDIPVKHGLHIDPVLCVSGRLHGANQHREIPMPFVIDRERYLLSPYFDHLSFLFNRNYRLPAGDIVTLMIKLADSGTGTMRGERADWSLTPGDREILDHAVEECREMLFRLGIRKEELFLGTLNGGHPGGMLPLSADDIETLHSPLLPEGLYVADATILPEALGKPPILTIMALAGRIARICGERF